MNFIKAKKKLKYHKVVQVGKRNKAGRCKNVVIMIKGQGRKFSKNY